MSTYLLTWSPEVMLHGQWSCFRHRVQQTTGFTWDATLELVVELKLAAERESLLWQGHMNQSWNGKEWEEKVIRVWAGWRGGGCGDTCCVQTRLLRPLPPSPHYRSYATLSFCQFPSDLILTCYDFQWLCTACTWRLHLLSAQVPVFQTTFPSPLSLLL